MHMLRFAAPIDDNAAKYVFHGFYGAGDGIWAVLEDCTNGQIVPFPASTIRLVPTSVELDNRAMRAAAANSKSYDRNPNNPT